MASHAACLFLNSGKFSGILLFKASVLSTQTWGRGVLPATLPAFSPDAGRMLALSVFAAATPAGRDWLLHPHGWKTLTSLDK